MELTQAYRYAAKVTVETMMAHDAAEGIAAFIERSTAQREDR
jgi:hypothetical protein